MSQKKFTSFDEFYPFYLSEHKNINCRRLHFAGSWVGIYCLFISVSRLELKWLAAALLCGYTLAWIGHFVFEKNKPASFRQPIYSFIGDWVMFRDILCGKVKI